MRLWLDSIELAELAAAALVAYFRNRRARAAARAAWARAVHAGAVVVRRQAAPLLLAQ